MGLIVVDASVAVKWVIEEPDSALAAQLLGSAEPMVAPELLRTEGAGAVTRAFRSGRLTREAAEASLELWLDAFRSVVELVPNEHHLRRAAELSCDLRHPLADCLYLALAERLGATLLTADTTFARRASASFPQIRLLNADA